MKILLTAFDPFGGEPINPAEQAVSQVRAPAGVELVRLTLPTVFGLSARLLWEAVEREEPDAVLCVGQAAGRAAVSVERLGVNLMDAAIPDNAGRRPAEEPVVPGAPAAFFSTLPVKRIAAAIEAAGVSAAVSNTAGTFVCNQLLYALLEKAARLRPALRGGFIHVPALPEQAARMKPGTPSMALDDMVRALEAALGAIAEET